MHALSASCAISYLIVSLLNEALGIDSPARISAQAMAVEPVATTIRRAPTQDMSAPKFCTLCEKRIRR